ncbi:MAG: sensor domain-containing diguanylate cyclase, partial [Blastocatellia bacterium]|nr:sensor domain-containing diguanylate cyclase [Blastocatellia bacterium]
FHTPNIGLRVAGPVLLQGSPVLVDDIAKIGMASAPLDWSYKTPSFVSYPLLIGNRRIAVMNFTDKATGGSFEKSDLDLLQAIAPQIAVAIDRTRLKDQAGQYKQLSVTDPLTGLLNRRYMDPRLAEELKRSKRHGFPLALLLLDIDDFKSYNDTFGHPAGDSALRKVAEVLKASLRGVDVAARWGGEEFAILLPNTKTDEAFLIAERIRVEVETAEMPKRRITVSIGIATESPEIDTSGELIQAADFALYEAKNRGRNTVCIFDVASGSIDSTP